MEVEKILIELLEHKGKVDEALKGVVAAILDLKTNDLKHIQVDIQNIFKKLSSRPSWAVSIIITFLCTIVGVLLVVIFK